MLTLLGHVPKQYHNTVSQDRYNHSRSAPEFIKTRRMGESAAVSFGSDQSFKSSKTSSAEEMAFCVLSHNSHVYSSTIAHWGHLFYIGLFAVGFLAVSILIQRTASTQHSYYLPRLHNDTP